MSEIDLVIPMVFPEDKEWQQAYARFRSGDASRNVRFRSWGTEEMMVRCCLKNMPWLRRIYLLLASPSQVRGWMKNMVATESQHTEKTGVHLVFHEEFIPEEFLPCFTSPTIEMFLHRIPGLAEHFIYANDDMFPLSPLEATDFFRERPTPNPPYREGAVSLLPCQHWEEKNWPVRPSLFQRKCRNQQRMIAAGFGVQLGNTWLRNGHCFAPLLKSTCEAVWERHGEEIKKHLSPLKRTEHSYNHYIYSLYQHFAGLEVDYQPKEQYAGKDTPTSEIAKIISDPEAGIVCINDHERISDWRERAKIVRDNLNVNDNDNLNDNVNDNDNLNDNVNDNEDDNDDDNDEGIRVLIVHYNTPELTAAAVRSLWKHTPEAKVTVLDNSDLRPFCCDEIAAYGEVEVIDNTKGQVVNWEAWLETFPDKIPAVENNWGSAKHCYSVEVMMDRFPDGFLLMDSDVLIKKDVRELVDRSVPWKGGVQVNTRRFGLVIPRVIPFLCWINTPMLKAHGIRYFNGAKMWNLTSKTPDNHYDTGAWLLEACKKAGLEGHRIEIRDYIEHYGHGSWRLHKSEKAWIEEHHGLWWTCPDTKIYICTHTDFTAVVNDPVYEVVDARQYNDDYCENGLHGSFYSELILYKYIAEREDLPEYVGFCGYRKYYSFLNNVPDIPSLLEQYDAIAATPVRVKPDVISQYGRCHNAKDMDLVGDIIREHHPDLWPVWERSLRLPELYACDMFIVRREDFREMMVVLFDILDRYVATVGTDIEGRIMAHQQDYHIGMNAVSTLQYQRRIGGFIGERIVNALLRQRFKRIKHFDKVITQRAVVCP